MPGQNLGIPSGVACFAFDAAGSASFLCCAVGPDQRAATATDLLHRGNPSGLDGAVRLAADPSGAATFEVDFAAVPGTVAKLLFLAFRDEGEGSSRSAPQLLLTSRERALASFRADGVSADIVFLGEAYRRGADWKFRALGQEFRTLQDVASFLGLDGETVRLAVRSAPEPTQAPIAAAAVPRVNLGRPARTPAAPPPDPTVSRPGGREPGLDASPELPTDGARGFAASGWELTPAGVSPGPVRAMTPVVDRELLDLRSGAAGAVWPGFFTHDPLTGDPLEVARVAPIAGSSLANGAGLLEVGDAGRLDAAGRLEVGDVPTGARLFANGGLPPRLIAIDPWEGRSWWRAPLSREWVPLGKLPPAGRTPLSSLGAVGTSAGVFYAASGVLAHLLRDQAPSIRPISLEGDHVAPPFALGTVVAVPLDAGGRLRVASVRPDGNVHVIDVRDAPSDIEQLGRPFGEPEAGRGYWLGCKGFLSLDDAVGRPVARWNAWPDEVEGLPFLPPYLARNGKLWAFATRTSGGGRSREGAVACSLGPDGVRDVRDLPGPFLSVGQAVFRGRERFRDPWAAAEEEVSLGLDYPGRWLLPLVRIGGRQTLVGLVAEPPGASTVRDFVFRGEPRRVHGVALAVHTDNGALELLRQSFEIGSTDDLDVFRDGDRVCVNHAESDTCASWPLV